MTYSETLSKARALLRQQQVRDRTGLSRSTLYKLISEGDFPSPIQLAGRSVAWDSQAVDAWIESRIAASV